MIRRILARLATALMLLLVAGCASSAIKQIGSITVPLDATQTKTEIATKVGYLVTLELPPVELAGYGWQVFMLDTRFLQQKTEIRPATTAGGRATVSFLALQPTERAVGGKTTVRFLLAKLDGAKEAQPVDAHFAFFVIE